MRPYIRELRAMLISALAVVVGCARYQLAPPIEMPVRTASDSVRLTVETPAIAEATLPTVRQRVLANADELLGTRYRYGGSSPEEGFDCSGFVQFVFSREGIDLPRTARAMSVSGIRVAARRAVLLPGDLLFFAESGSRVSHVAIYVGDGRIIHASSGEGEVRYEDLDSVRGEWFRRHVTSARRYFNAREGQEIAGVSTRRGEARK